jgi:hypothetical protein
MTPDPETAFLDFRNFPASWAGDGGTYDFTGLAPGESRCIRFLMGISSNGGGTCTVRAIRAASGELAVTADPGQYEPVLEDGTLIGLRFPGCDRYPWQPHDPERDGDISGMWVL